MKKILLFGAGKSATVLIDYLLRNALAENWIVTVVDANLELAKSKIGNALGGAAVSFDINDKKEREKFIEKADLVISLLPPALHGIVAYDCLLFKKNLLTASYVDDVLRNMEKEVAEKGLLFLCEMGLDPGIDHMSAKKMIDDIHEKGGKITSFMSHCGGLVSPQSDDNPWHYKISWNPGNIVNAGKAGAHFLLDGAEKHLTYKDLFSEKRFVNVHGSEPLCWYPNRDSLSYRSVYGLEDCNTFIRTTLRHPDFIYGWKNVVDLELTSDEKKYATNGKTLKAFFQEHMHDHGFNDWLQKKMQEQFRESSKILGELVKLISLEKNDDGGAEEQGIEEFMVVNDKGHLQEVDIDDVKSNAALSVAEKMHDAKLTLKQLFFLGMDDDITLINRHVCSAAEVLQMALEKKLALQPGDKDLVVMIHEIEYEAGGEKFKTTATLSIEGDNDQYTAMAKTVGLPLGIAAKLILNDTIREAGLLIPVLPTIYKPVLKELEKAGIRFHEETTRIS